MGCLGCPLSRRLNRLCRLLDRLLYSLSRLGLMARLLLGGLLGRSTLGRLLSNGLLCLYGLGLGRLLGSLLLPRLSVRLLSRLLLIC